jgi:hypothetical protein
MAPPSTVSNGPYTDWQTPLPLARSTVAYAVANPGCVRRELRRSIRWLGRRRGHGHGQVLGIDVEEYETDFSLTRDVALTRQGGSRMIRPREYLRPCRVRRGR